MKNPCPLPLGPVFEAGVGADAYCLAIFATVGCAKAGDNEDISSSSGKAEGMPCSCCGSPRISLMLTVAPAII